MSGLTDRITEVLQQHRELRWSDNTYSCSCEWDAGEGLKRGTSDEHFTHVADRVEAELAPELGELEAAKMLLHATREQLNRTIADFCALRDALPRRQVQQILAAVEVEL